MSRRIRNYADIEYAYKVVVVETYESGIQRRYDYGPYHSETAAKSYATRKENQYKYRNSTPEVWIERSVVSWEKMV